MPIGVVVDVVDDKAGAGQRAPEDRQKIDQERSSACDDGRYADTRHGLGPARGRRLEQAVVHRTVVGPTANVSQRSSSRSVRAALFSES